MPVSEQLRVALDGRYRIEREIGAGGMATVYLAEDLKHRRKVALKVLRPQLAAVLGTERFLSEINVTANLQHPHLLPLFDSGEADGLLFYVMPYVEGETLRSRLVRERQLPVDEAVRIAAAVASALGYAHRHNVIHRDLKPENILLHEGQPLVADFGIALAVSNAGGARVTQTGLSLGTPQYMSPEQATGDRVIDARSDVYSLGAVLYEMLVGDPPHVAGTTQGIIAKVLTEPAPRVRAYRASVPERIDAAVHTALAKLPADRFNSASDFAEALLGTRAMPALEASAGAHGADAPHTRSMQTDPRRLVRWLPWAVAGAAVFVAGARVLDPRDEPGGAPAIFDVTFADSVELRTPGGVTLAITRDGSRLAFAGRRGGETGIFVRNLADFSADFVRGTEGANGPVFSPDGREIVFLVDNSIRKVPASGGAPITLADTIGGAGWTWTERGEILFMIGASIQRVPAAGGGKPVVVATRDTARGHRDYRWLHALPGGRAALLTVLKEDATLATAELAVVTIPDGEIRELGVIGTGPRYLPRERVVIFGREDGSILAAPFSLRSLRFTGPPTPEPVLEGVRVKGGGAVELAVSDNGTLIYRSDLSLSSQLVIVDRAGVRKQSLRLEQIDQPRVSPDGRHIAFRAGGAGDSDVWRYDLSARTTTLVTSNGGSHNPVWLDRQRIVYRNMLGRPHLEVQSSDGSGAPEPFGPSEHGMLDIAVGPPGGYHVYQFARSSGAQSDFSIAPTDSPQAAQILMATPAQEETPTLSSDGRLLAYVSDHTGMREVYVRPIPGPDRRVQLSIGGGEEPVWRSNRELIYRGSGWFRRVTITTEPELDILRRDDLFADIYASFSNFRNYDVFPNGDLAVVERSGPAERLIGMTNWTPTPIPLRLAPTR